MDSPRSAHGDGPYQEMKFVRGSCQMARLSLIRAIRLLVASFSPAATESSHPPITYFGVKPRYAHNPRPVSGMFWATMVE